MTNVEEVRESRAWWVVSDGRVREALGLSCAPDNPTTWWFPTVGYSMTEGVHVFATRAEARTRARKDLKDQQEIIDLKLAALGEQ